MFYYITGYQNGDYIYEDAYAKKIARIIDSAEPGEEVSLDVTKLTEIAIKNGKGLSGIFVFDNLNNKVIVSLRQGAGTSFSYFRDLDVIDLRLENPSPVTGATTNRLYFKIVEARRNDRL